MRVVGYIYDSGHWCAQCIEDANIDPSCDEVGVVFEDSVCDYPMHCHACDEFLGGELTADGFDALKQNYLDGNYRGPNGGPDAQFEEYMEAFDYGSWHFIWTFIGPMDPYGEVLD